VLRGTLAVAVSACCFGSISPLTIIATERGFALSGVQAVRYLTTALLLLAVAAWRRRAGLGRPPAHGRSAAAAPAPWYAPQMLLVAGGGQATVATLALLALRWLPAATASFLFYTYPAWVALMAMLRGTESMDGRKAVALLLSLSGIAAMVGAPDAAALPAVGVAVILAAALVYAFYIPVLGRLQAAREGLDVALAISCGGAALFLTWAIADGALRTGPDPVALGASVLQGLLSAGAFLGFLAGLRVLGPVRTAITSTVEPFWTTLLGVGLLGQPLGAGTVGGGVAIMVAVVLLQRSGSAGTDAPGGSGLAPDPSGVDASSWPPGRVDRPS